MEDKLVTPAWVTMIKWINTNCPDCKASFQFVNGEPVKLIGQPELNVRFDKQPRSKKVEFSVSA